MCKRSIFRGFRCVLLLFQNDLPPSSAKAPPPHQPSVVFTAQQTIGDPSVDPNTSVLSPQLSHSPPNHRLQPLLPSGLLKDACVSKASAGLALSDDILDSLQLPEGGAPSGRHERRTPGVPSDCGTSVRATEAPAESSPQVTLRGPKSISPGPAPQRLERNSSPLSSLHQSNSHDAPAAPSSPQRDCEDGALRSLLDDGEDLENIPGLQIPPYTGPDLCLKETIHPSCVINIFIFGHHYICLGLDLSFNSKICLCRTRSEIEESQPVQFQC